MKTRFYSKQFEDFKVECFKLNDVDELSDNAYEIIGTNLTTKETVSLTTNVPQAAIALADKVFDELSKPTNP